MKKVLFILIILVGAYYKYHKPVAESSESATYAEKSSLNEISSGKLSGFTRVYMPQGAKNNEVLILTPIYCTSDEVQKGINLENAIKSQGIPVIRKEGFSINARNISAQDKTLIDQSVSLFKSGNPPIVFINGYGKSSPTASEVISAFKATQ